MHFAVWQNDMYLVTHTLRARKGRMYIVSSYEYEDCEGGPFPELHFFRTFRAAKKCYEQEREKARAKLEADYQNDIHYDRKRYVEKMMRNLRWDPIDLTSARLAEYREIYGQRYVPEEKAPVIEEQTSRRKEMYSFTNTYGDTTIKVKMYKIKPED